MVAQSRDINPGCVLCSVVAQSRDNNPGCVLCSVASQSKDNNVCFVQWHHSLKTIMCALFSGATV